VNSYRIIDKAKHRLTELYQALTFIEAKCSINMRKPRPETDQACRSLLQKAVRRGNTELTKVVAEHLAKTGDKEWLKNRLSVIVFEECWVLGGNLKFTKDENITEALIKIARSVKIKDAAGLGSLGYALSQGDFSVLCNLSSDRDIKIISEAIKRPHDFWEWVINECPDEEKLAIVNSAYKGFKRGGWPWDRAFMQASAYLSVVDSLPEVYCSESISQIDDFPFWIAIDKHTSKGKEALREVSKIFKIPYRQITWASFYCESAITNQSSTSYWWTREVDWRLGKVGLTLDTASKLWKLVSPTISKILQPEAKKLASCFLSESHNIQNISQLVLF